ncbi:MAG: hypothetical protein KC503_41190 [Myxococcales bacterium]|nr:hypothetical protein [Myxococcales bacterium]
MQKLSRRSALLLITFTAVMGAVGCAVGDDGATPGLMSGHVLARSGQAQPAHAKVMVLWEVSATSPDYIFKFGEGAVGGNRFQLHVDTPPLEALNDGRLGVGHLVLFNSTFTTPDGRPDWDVVKSNLIGGAEQYALIYRHPSTGGAEGSDWWLGFPVGLSCGKVTPPREGSPWVGFEPVDCSTLQVIAAPDVKLPNWT